MHLPQGVDDRIPQAGQAISIGRHVRGLQPLAAIVLTMRSTAAGPSGVIMARPPVRVRRFLPGQRPYEEHDFGAFEAEGHTILFKIDYLDTTLTFHSPDPADPAVTERVLTTMLAEEY